MARRGTKPQPDALKVIKGTFEAAKSHQPAVKLLEGTPTPPKWLQGRALELWHEKVAIYQRRGQPVVGCEAALAQYCSLENELIDAYTRQLDIPVAKINAHRIYANEFYDTPASQHVPTRQREENRFARNGQRLA
jgi:phage terminase small subunit